MENKSARRVSMASIKPQISGKVSFLCGQSPHQNGNKNDVVDTQDDLQGRQGSESNPGFRTGQPCKHNLSPFI